MASCSTPLLFALLLAVAAVVECDPIFFSRKNSRESDRSRERSSFSSFQTSVDSSDENAAGKTIKTSVHVFRENPLQTPKLNFGWDIIVGKPAIPIQSPDDIAKVVTTIRRKDHDINFDDTDDFGRSDEISLDNERLTTQKRTNQLGPLTSLRDIEAILRLEAYEKDSFEDKNDHSKGADSSDETAENETNENLEISNERSSARNPQRFLSSVGRPVNFPATISSGQPVRNNVSAKSSISSVVGRISPPSGHSKDKDERKEASDHSASSRTSKPNDGRRSDEDEAPSSAIILSRKTTSRGRQVRPVEFSVKNKMRNLQNIIEKNSGRLVDVRSGGVTTNQNYVGFKSGSTVEDKVSTETSQEINSLEKSRETVSLTDSSEEKNGDDRVEENDNTDSNDSDETLSEKAKKNDHVNYTSPGLNQSDERSSKIIFPVLPEIVRSLPSLQTKGIKDVSLESGEAEIESLEAYHIREPEPIYVPPVYIPSAQRHTPPLKHYRPSSLPYSTPHPSWSAVKLKFDDSEESDIKSLKPFKSFPNAHFPIIPKQRHSFEVIDIDSDETLENFSSYQPHKLDPPLNSEHTEIESVEFFVNPFSTSHLSLKPQQLLKSDELIIDSDEYIIHKHKTHGITSSYSSSSPLKFDSRTKSNSFSSLTLPSQSSPTLNDKFESDEVSDESLIDAALVRKIPQPIFSQYPSKTLKQTKTAHGQEYSPPVIDIISSHEFESDEIDLKDSDEATLKIIPAVRISSTYSAPSEKYSAPVQINPNSSWKPSSSFQKSSPSTPYSSQLVKNVAPFTNTYESPKQTAVHNVKSSYRPLHPYSAPMVTKQVLVSHPKVNIPHHQNSKLTKAKTHPLKTVKNHRVVHNKVASAPQIVPQQKFRTTIQPKPIKGSPLQPQQPMSYGGQLAQYSITTPKLIKGPLLQPPQPMNYGQLTQYSVVKPKPLKGLLLQPPQPMGYGGLFAQYSVATPKPIQGLLLQPQQPMRYGGQFTHYVRQKGRAVNALLLTPLNSGKDLHSYGHNKYIRGTYGLQPTNVPQQTVRQPIRTYHGNVQPNLNAGHINKKKKLYSTSSSLPTSSGFLNLGSAGVPLPRQQPIKSFSSFSTDSDEIIIQKSAPASPVISPNYGAPLEASYQAPQQSYEAPAVCEPVVQYSVVTHDVLVPTTVEVYRTKYLPTTQYNQVIETKYYAKPQVNVVTVTSVPEPQIVTKTEVATNPVYVAQTNYETVTKYLTATQANIVTDTRVLFKTKYNTVTDVQYRTQTQYQTKTKYRTQYQTQTEINYQTKIEYQTQYLTSTAISKVPVYNTVTETQVKKQYITETVQAYQTKTSIQQKVLTETVTSQYPFYTTVVSTQFHPQYVTVTVTQPCNTGYGFY